MKIHVVCWQSFNLNGVRFILVSGHVCSHVLRVIEVFNFRLRRPIQLVLLVPVGHSSFLLHLRLVLLVVEASVARPGQLTVGVQIIN